MDKELVVLASGLSFVLGIATIFLWQKRANSSPEILSRRVLANLGLVGEGKDVTHAFTHGIKKRKELANQYEQDALRSMESCEKKIEKAQEGILNQLTEVSRAEEKIEHADTKGKRSILIQSELSRPLKKIETEMRLLSAESNHYASEVSLMLFWNAVKQGRSRKRSLDDLIDKTSIVKEFNTKLDEHMIAVTKTLQMGESSHERVMQTWIEKTE